MSETVTKKEEKNKKEKRGSHALQNGFLRLMIKQKKLVRIYMNSGKVFSGIMKDTDMYTIRITNKKTGKSMLLFKHHIEAISPVEENENTD